jgi:hypothetical protein
MSNSTRLYKTLRCKQAVSVGNTWFKIETVIIDDGQREAMIITPRLDRPEGSGWCNSPKFARSGEKVEVLKNVFVTFLDISKKSRLRLLIEAPSAAQVTMGFPHERKPRLVISNG